MINRLGCGIYQWELAVEIEKLDCKFTPWLKTCKGMYITLFKGIIIIKFIVAIWTWDSKNCAANKGGFMTHKIGQYLHMFNLVKRL